MYENYPPSNILMGSILHYHYRILRSKEEMDFYIKDCPNSLIIFHNNNTPADLTIIVDTVICKFKKVGTRATFNLNQIPEGQYGWADELRKIAPYPGLYSKGIMKIT